MEFLLFYMQIKAKKLRLPFYLSQEKQPINC
jgi:hypothetical protein